MPLINLKELENVWGKGMGDCTRKLLSAHRRKAVAVANRSFLLECRGSGIVPEGLRGRILHNTEAWRDAARKVGALQLKTGIEDTHRRIAQLNREIAGEDEKLRSGTNDGVFSFLQTGFRTTWRAHYDSHRSTHLSKLSKLREEALEGFKLDEDNWVDDRTEGLLPQGVKRFLALGEKFALPTVIDRVELVGKVENLCNGLPFEAREDARLKLVKCLHGNLEQRGSGPNIKLITGWTKVEIDLFFRKQRNNLIILKADKASKLVVLRREFYSLWVLC